MKLKTILLSLTLIFGISHISFADFEDGLTAYNSGEYTKAFQEWQILAEDGQVRAQYNVAWMYAYGVGTLKDYQASVAWYKKAAEQDYVHAQYNLANMYLRGDVKNDEEAVYWFRRAAEQGDAPAQYNLGIMYANGKGVTKDMAQCKIWIKKAAENNDPKIRVLAETFWKEQELAKY
jgi:hypothetical protein